MLSCGLVSRAFHLVPAAIVLVGSGALASSSCRDVVAGDALPVGSELCGLIEDCYGAEAPSCADIDAALRGAEPQVVNDFLVGFDPDQCLGSCADSRACLDAAPLCGAEGCKTELDCCGWSRGEAACGGKLPQTKERCCLPDGIACERDDQCCDSRCREVGDGAPGKRTCGGSECTAVGGACAENRDCCTEICIDQVCNIRDCVPLFEPCKVNEDCCPTPLEDEVIGQGIECREDRCQPVETNACSPFGEYCSLDGIQSCCDGVLCIPDVMSTYGLCGIEPCRPDYSPCEVNEQCCSMFCDPQTFVCAVGVSCAAYGDMCFSSEECCSGNCDGGSCGLPIGCNPSECHDICSVGAPMAPGACAGEPNAWCIDQIASSDSYCACTEWDTICVGSVIIDCMIDCSVLN